MPAPVERRIFLQNTVTVELVNNGDFGVRAVIFYDDLQEVPEFVLVETGQEIEITVPAGGRQSFSRSCDDFQAMIVEDADLLVIGGAGPDASTDVLRDGDDFNCGSTITLTFDHSVTILDFDVTVSTSGF